MDILIKILEALLAFLKRGAPTATGEAPNITGEAPNVAGEAPNVAGELEPADLNTSLVEALIAIYACSLTRAQHFAQPLAAAMALYEINTTLRQAHFLAQIGHESGRLQHTREIWGPTKAQRRYEGRKDLGNTEPGDGSRYRGRGLIQVTGRANYAKASAALGPDFVAYPERLEDPEWASLSAAEFWHRNGCNELADADDVVAVTKRVNGGTNGLAERTELLEKARKVLGC